MSLPIVIEIAIGLIFIYLTLSLVASEIQEILSALFQWRAEHLKRSIEQLIAGDGLLPSTPTAKSLAIPPRPLTAKQAKNINKAFADSLYSTPLIANLNYEAQGRVTGFFRSILHGVGAIYRTITFTRNVFGKQTSGPSYIPAETFATSLIDRLKLKDFQRLLVRSRFSDFINNEINLPLHNTVNELRAQLANEELLAAEMTYFEQSIHQITADLTSQRLTLASALNQVMGQLQDFETMAADAPLIDLGASPAMVQSFLNRLRYLRVGLSGQTSDSSILLARLTPSLSDLTALLDPSSPTYAELVTLAQREGDAAISALETLQQTVIPPRLRDSLSTLAQKAESRSQAATGEILQLQQEIEGWFNNGMERASGVYRRNVKGVGILIGFAIAYSVNADTFNMFQQLSTDHAVRSSILQTAEQLELRGIDSTEALANDLSIDQLSEQIEGDLRSIGLAVEDTLASYPLPIGRTPALLAKQQAAQQEWPIPFIPRRFVGWAITAIALSMGASFWFDLLRKITAVRASGNRPKS